MATNSSVTIGSTTTSILTANSGRNFVSLQNDSDEDIYIAFGADAVSAKGINLKSGGSALLLNAVDYDIIREDINGICASGSKTLLVVTR